MSESVINECENEKLHLSGQIQSFGALLAFSKADLSITHASENIEDFLGKSPGQLFGLKAADISEQFGLIVDELEFDENRKFLTRKVNYLNNHLYAMRFSEDDEHIIVDIEHYQQSDSITIPASAAKTLALSPTTSIELDQFYQCFVDTLKSIIGFDRVMIYEFQEDWSGVVVAEASHSELGSYLDLRWPASDIPKIARDLYAKNPSRIICDAHDPQVNIVSNDASPIDLTYSETRSVSPVHLEYLSNMGVKASFSLSIMVNGQLWGLVACHHTSPKNLDALTKFKAIELTSKLKRSIQLYMAKLKMKHFDDREIFLNQIVNNVTHADNLFTALRTNQETLLSYIEVDGFAIRYKDRYLMLGDSATVADIRKIANHIKNTQSDEVLQTQSIQSLSVLDADYKGPCGVLAVNVANHKGHSLSTFWFKNEVIQEVTWAGNPNKPMAEDVHATRLAPRKSFEQWVETKKGHSKPFGPFDDGAALRLSKRLLETLSFE